ncbi:hypothetical protein FOZ62_031793, partial [Perkinsus olseni]
MKSKSAISDWTDSWKSEKSRDRASSRRQTSPPGESWAGYSSQKKHSGRGWGSAAVEKSTEESANSRRDFSSWGGSWKTFASGKGGSGDSGGKGAQESSGGSRKSRLSESWHFADSGSTPSFGGDQDDDDVASWASSTSSEAIVVKTPVKRHARVEPGGRRDERTSGKVMRRSRSPGRALETQVLRGARVNSPARKSVGIGSDEGLQPVKAMGPRKARAPKSAEMNRQDTYKPTRGFGRPPSVPYHGGGRTAPSSAPQKWDLLSAGWSTQGEVKRACHHDCDWMNPEHHHWPHQGGGTQAQPERIDPRETSEQQWQERTDLGSEPSRQEGAQRERFVPRPIIALVAVDPTDGALTTLGRVDWRANEDIEGLRQRAVCDLAQSDPTRGRSAEVDCERATRLDDSLEREQQAGEQQPRCEEGGGESSQEDVVEHRLDGERRVSERGGRLRESLLDVALMEGRDEGRRKSKRGEVQEAFVMDDAFVALEEHYQEVERFERRQIPVEEYVPEPAQPGAEYRPSVRPSTGAVVETLEPAIGFVKHHVHKDAGKTDENARARSLSQKTRARSPSQGGPRPCVGPQEKRRVDGPMAGPRPLTPQLRGRALAVLPAEEMNGGVQQRTHLEEVTWDAYHQPNESSSPPTVFHYHHIEESE